ncbi:E3 ubiquitin-protein ligase TRIM71-like [Tubulanus polymorphus]|uniref:E3 ubiquitin-protein ligase TRIM71-like n=1 Tax=Tubulanus polymorphus TaxID=672921 RepID=UPI003DA2B384
MATGGATGMNGSHLDDLLKCSICYDYLKDPRTLPCLHTFCTECLQGLYNATIHSDISGLLSYDIISCPTCRTRTIVPPGGVTGFPNDFKVSKISEIVSDNNRLSLNDGDGVSPTTRRCDICKFTNRHIQASVFCVECSRYFCSGCINRHDNRVLLKGHQKYELMKQKFVDIKCEIHDSENVQYFCDECKESICLHCTITGRHSNHDIIELGNGIQQCELNLKECAEKLTQKLEKIKISVYKLNDIEKQMKNIGDESIELVKMRVREMIISIKKREHQLLNELDEQNHENQIQVKTDVQNIEILEKSIDEKLIEITRILNEENEEKIIDASRNLAPKIKRLLEECETYGTDRDRAGGDRVRLSKFIPSKKNIKLGKIQQFTVTAEKIEQTVNTFRQIPFRVFEYPRLIFLSKFSTSSAWVGDVSYPQIIESFPDGNLVIADTNNCSIQIFDVEGNYIKSIIEGAVKPLSIVVTGDGNIAVADLIDRKIKIVDIDGNIVREFGEFCSPCGITINSKRQFIVTDFNQNSLEIYSPEYTRLRKQTLHDYRATRRHGYCRPITDSRDNIYISDVGDQTITKYDQEGAFVKKFYVADDDGELTGLCVDKFDRILFADKCRSRISILDPESGDQFVLLDKKSGLRSPSDVTITSQRHLVIVEGSIDCVRVYQMCDVNWQTDLPVLTPEDSDD